MFVCLHVVFGIERGNCLSFCEFNSKFLALAILCMCVVRHQQSRGCLSARFSLTYCLSLASGNLIHYTPELMIRDRNTFAQSLA